MTKTRAARPVVFTVDDNYVRPLCVALRSLAAANPALLDALEVVVLHESLSRAGIERLRAHAADVGLALRLCQARSGAEDYPLWGWISPAAYLRLSMARALPDYDSAVYLDADTLVLGDLAPLLAADLGGAPVAAVQDPLNPVVGCGIGLFGWRDLGLDGDREYFNSGVLVFDLSACRDQEVFTRAAWLVRHRPQHLLFPDQDALNWAVEDRWVRLDRRWNTFPVSVIAQRFGPLPCAARMLPMEVLLADESRASILHYAGPLKPWTDDFPDGPLRDRYTVLLRRVDDLNRES